MAMNLLSIILKIEAINQRIVILSHQNEIQICTNPNLIMNNDNKIFRNVPKINKIHNEKLA